MCYSAQRQAAYMKYLRETGAEMDIDQFVEIFGARVADSNIRIPRAIERWFDEPRNDKEARIKSFIDQWRSAEITRLEREVFAQKKRLADAERTLASRPTKAAAESQRIAGNKIELALTRLERLKAPQPHPAEARIFPLHYAPIVLQDGGRRIMRLARYHCRLPHEPAFVDRKLPGLYNARRDSLGKYWKGLFGLSHAVMLVDSFFENVQRDGRNQVLHFVPKPAGTMLIACLYAQWEDRAAQAGAPGLLSFAAITDEPPPEVAAAGHDRMIINLKPEHLDAWLSPQGRSPEELQAILSDRQTPYYEHEVMAA
ncbi:MAG TPA: SOS response-associated peptidase family protein [Steroidobacteraceae bacterium]|nr:SOS response-associated peptidase family protein [Steroidobacteraceae bacterium]